jgi:O-antigen/teichoic acid export membrane protein
VQSSLNRSRKDIMNSLPSVRPSLDKIRVLMPSFFEKAGKSTLFRKSALAFMLKTISAPLAYLMLVVLARSMTVEEFGRFSVAFSLGLFLGKVAEAGQPQLVLRELGSQDPKNSSIRHGVVVFGYLLTLGASLLVGMGVVAWGVYTQQAVISVTALFVLAMAISQLQTSILRSYGSIIYAISMREVAWRLVVIGVIPLVTLGTGTLRANQGMLIVTGMLFGVILAQAASHPSTRALWNFKARAAYNCSAWFPASRRFWITTVVATGAPALSTVVVGALQPIEVVGPFFAAFKAAQLLNLVQIATNVVAAPLLAREYAKGELTKLQRLCSLTALASSGAALLGLLTFLLFGHLLLRVFGTGYDIVYPELIVMSVGYALTASFGQNAQILQMTGHERTFMLIMIVSNMFGLTSLFLMTHFWGTMGAAVSITLTFAVWNVWAWLAALSLCKIDTSALGIIRLRK